MEDSPGNVRDVGSHVQVAAVVEMVEVAKHSRKQANYFFVSVKIFIVLKKEEIASAVRRPVGVVRFGDSSFRRRYSFLARFRLEHKFLTC